MLTIDDVTLKAKRVLIREDFNVPLDNGRISDETRLDAALPTLKTLIKSGAKIIIASHLGRPTPGEFESKYSLAPVAKRLSELLDYPVRLASDWQQGVNVNDEIVLLENIRFETGEKSNSPELAKSLANLCDIFIMDAFATAHRKHASTYGVIEHAPVAIAGPLLVKELNALGKGLQEPERPLLAIVGGAKVSSKLSLLETLISQVDRLIVGGGIANTFLAASGKAVGASLYEPDLVETAARIMKTAASRGVDLPLPTDVMVASEFKSTATASYKSTDDVTDEDLILDIGHKTAQHYQEIISSSNTIIWNGPVGVFEFEAFADGTKAVASAIAKSTAFSIAGGGDTVSAINKFHVADDISYISTGGGAFLAYIENNLPAVEKLQQRSDAWQGNIAQKS